MLSLEQTTESAFVRTLTATILSITLTFVTAAAQAESAAPQAQLQACIDLQQDSARLACYDALFRTPEAPKVVASKPPELGDDQVRRAKPIAERNEPETLNATVIKVTRRARNELAFELDNEQLWAQVTPRYLSIKAKDRVIIKKGRLGGYILTTERGGSTRVKRLR